jgi:predicted PurR-regulated permease PerM
MKVESPRAAEQIEEEANRVRLRTGIYTLAALTVIGTLLCLYVAYPFLPALAWALALAVIAFPLHTRLGRIIPWPNVAAAVSTIVVVVIILVPILLVGSRLAEEASAVASKAEGLAANGNLEQAAAWLPGGYQTFDWIRANVDLPAEVRSLVTRFAGDAAALAQGSVWVLVQLLVCVFVLFFAFRDWRHLLEAVRSLSPLSPTEADYLFTRVSDSIHATVYATIMTSLLQGITGGLLFWALGLPAPMIWGVVMTILGILPVVGAFLIWVPAAVYLASDGRWGAAVALVSWGLVMAGPVTNYVYAYLAGGRMRLHQVPVLISFVGGLVVFGISGMVLGPVVLVVTLGLIDVWRRRMNPQSESAAEIESTGTVVAAGKTRQERSAPAVEPA